jgi:hypothetical protein
MRFQSFFMLITVWRFRIGRNVSDVTAPPKTEMTRRNRNQTVVQNERDFPNIDELVLSARLQAVDHRRDQLFVIV